MSKQSFRLFSYFCRSLSHRLRTPLSVLANEISYIETLLPPGDELNKSKDKLKVVLEILKFGGFTRDLNNIVASQSVLAAVSGVVKKLGSSAQVLNRSDECAISFNLSHFSYVLGSIVSLVSACKDLKLEVSGSEVLVSGLAAFIGTAESFELFSDFAAKFEADYFVAPLVDSIILENQWLFSGRFVEQQFFIILRT